MGRGKDLKNQAKSNGYLSKFFKNLKYFADKFLEKVRSLNKTLTFVRSDKIGGVGSFAAREVPGASVFGLFIYQTVYRKIKKIVLRTKRKPLDRCTQNTASKLSLASCRGAILIEFAICMPILIILLFYIHDLMRIKRLYSQTEFVAQQMANMIQNISQKRGDKKITKEDLHYISALANLSIYPGTTMFGKNQSSVHFPQTFVHCIKGLSGGKATKLWYVQTCFYRYTSPSSLWGNANKGDDNFWTTVRGQNVVASKIHPSLKINEGEVKIIVESFFHVHSGDEKKAFGLHLVTPKQYSLARAYFPSVAIFSPKPNLFTEDVPT